MSSKLIRPKPRPIGCELDATSLKEPADRGFLLVGQPSRAIAALDSFEEVLRHGSVAAEAGTTAFEQLAGVTDFTAGQHVIRFPGHGLGLSGIPVWACRV